MLVVNNFFFQYEILFCIQEVDDPAHEVVDRLMSKHPNIEAKVVTGAYQR